MIQAARSTSGIRLLAATIQVHVLGMAFEVVVDEKICRVLTLGEQREELAAIDRSALPGWRGQGVALAMCSMALADQRTPTDQEVEEVWDLLGVASV